ncbi:MAG: molybdenum cofactor biosynthesis protein MoaE [Opitutaceae bacterium]|nr:molybdenum cofactor biosynthesis protein MoaE [Opitutaceae bacterium]
MFRLSNSPLEINNLHASLQSETAGGFVCFEGRVRTLNEGKTVTSLEYESYGPLAEKEGLRVIQEAKEKFPIIAASCVHRIGHLQIGDIAIWVGVISQHRGPSFEACRYIIDEIKSRLPIWKKEHYQDGDSGWINCEKPNSSSK